MPGANCSIFGCLVSRRQKYKGVSLFKVPSGKTEFDAKWRKQLIAVITKDRVIDSSLRDQIRNTNLYVCQRHFTTDQFYRHESKCTLNPGVIPTLNLPIKSIPSSSTITSAAVKNHRDSAESISKKRDVYVASHTLSSPASCYKSFDDFKSRVTNLKLNG